LSYSPFGETVEATGEVNEIPLRFSTKYFDEEAGLYWYGYRHYHLGLGRWLTRDVIELLERRNLYEFVNNDPINTIDTKGEWPFLVLLMDVNEIPQDANGINGLDMLFQVHIERSNLQK
jgi:RHS repeat-associated protein